MPSPTLLLLGLEGALRAQWMRELVARGWIVHDALDVQAGLDGAARHQPTVIVSVTQPLDAAGYHFIRALRAVIEHDVKIVGLVLDRSVSVARAGFDFLVDQSDTLDFDRLHESITHRRSDDEHKTTTKMPRLS